MKTDLFPGETVKIPPGRKSAFSKEVKEELVKYLMLMRKSTMDLHGRSYVI
jgi:hypothetical protein